ncbi:hypothetical protein [Paenibacillus sp. R14(2021)]|nr:hypothetical protein [Paenibacillus sp. R14(2021)]
MARRDKQTMPQKMKAMQDKDSQAENDIAGSTDRNRNQKGHVPNSPSTG